MIVLVHNKMRTGIGESLTGEKAFYVNPDDMDNWSTIENHPEYKGLDTEEQLSVKVNFLVSVERYKALRSSRFYRV